MNDSLGPNPLWERLRQKKIIYWELFCLYECPIWLPSGAVAAVVRLSEADCIDVTWVNQHGEKPHLYLVSAGQRLAVKWQIAMVAVSTSLQKLHSLSNPEDCFTQAFQSRTAAPLFLPAPQKFQSYAGVLVPRWNWYGFSGVLHLGDVHTNQILLEVCSYLTEQLTYRCQLVSVCSRFLSISL